VWGSPPRRCRDAGGARARQDAGGARARQLSLLRPRGLRPRTLCLTRNDVSGIGQAMRVGSRQLLGGGLLLCFATELLGGRPLRAAVLLLRATGLAKLCEGI